MPSSSPSPESPLASKSPAELIEMYVFHPDCGFRQFSDERAYHAALARNEAITAELVKRGEAAVATCQRHRRDLRNIFTGDGGPQENVAGVCRDLLTKLGHPTEQRIESQFCSQ